MTNKPNNLPAVSMGQRGIELRTIEDMTHMAQMIVKAGIAPKGMADVPKICVALQLGAEVGIPPMQAVQGIAVVNGRPTIWGDLGIALIQGSGLLDAAPEEAVTGEGDSMEAVCRIRRKGQSGFYEGRFTAEDAKRAGLAGKNTYQTWPKDMFLWRARWRAYKAGFADVLRGLTFREVIQDYPPREAEYEVKQPMDLADLAPAEPKEQLPEAPQDEPGADPEPDEHEPVNPDNPFAGWNDPEEQDR